MPPKPNLETSYFVLVWHSQSFLILIATYITLQTNVLFASDETASVFISKYDMTLQTSRFIASANCARYG